MCTLFANLYVLLTRGPHMVYMGTPYIFYIYMITCGWLGCYYTCVSSYLPNFCKVTIPCLLKSSQRFELNDFYLTNLFKHCASYQAICWNRKNCVIFISLTERIACILCMDLGAYLGAYTRGWVGGWVHLCTQLH